VRIALLVILLACPALAGGWLWLRHSSLVSVRRVQISGVHGPEAAAIDAALAGTATRMSTLDVRTGALRAAVAPFRIVRGLQATPQIPHGLRIRVVEQLPVAAMLVGGERTAVAADGVVLGPALLRGSLPSVSIGSGAGLGRHVRGASLLGALTLLGATPAPLGKAVATVFSGPYGLTVAMRDGLLVYFGDATRPHAKWLSLARVLADPSSSDASYIDVRVPERPAAGFPAGAGPAATSSSEGSVSSSEQPAPESIAGALAAGLAAAVPVSPTGPEAPASGQASAGATGATTSTPAEANAATPTEAPTQTPAETNPPTQPSTPSATSTTTGAQLRAATPSPED
jgi:cell division septal protein FtsQ